MTAGRPFPRLEQAWPREVTPLMRLFGSAFADVGGGWPSRVHRRGSRS